MAKVQPNAEVTNRRGYWSDEITKANKRWSYFHRQGKIVVDRYLLEREDAATDLYRDKYNMLYSSTETTRPSLYAKTPKVEATKRQEDRENPTVTLATLLMENATQYALEDIDFDDVMNNVVEDYLLPGLGQAWVRYEPTFDKRTNADKTEYEALSFEGLAVDYVHYKDFRTGVGRTWAELPWVSRAVYFNQKKATKRFGATKANRLEYSYRPEENEKSEARDIGGSGGNQALIWEIWDKENRKVVWYTDDYPDDILDEIPDPLKLESFFPCPRPLRAVSTTRSIVPKSFYSQYKAQAEELDNITERIRYLTQALRVIGLYDGSQEQLAQLLNGNNNKMVAVQNWAAFAQSGGINGAIQWLPIKEIAAVLTELLKHREVVKSEIYEITGFSDIIRGVSKASETLGAQKIKADWAGGRLRSLQKEVQRFCRDLIRIMSEIISEQFSEESLALYAGFEPPPVTPEEQAAAAQYAEAKAQYSQQITLAPIPGMPPPQQPQRPPPTVQQQAIAQFREVVKVLKNEKRRCALIGIETDSTIQPDEASERADRMEFLSSVGAFLQQAGPMALQYPDMRGLLGAIMMFAVRTFRASRPIEQQFEEFQKTLANQPAMPPPGAEGGSKADPEVEKAKIQADMQKEQMKQQTTMQTAQATLEAAQSADQVKKYEVDTKAGLERMKIQMDNDAKMRELDLKERELQLKEQELQLKRIDTGVRQVEAAAEQRRADADQDHQREMDEVGTEQRDRELDTAETAAKSADKPGKNDA